MKRVFIIHGWDASPEDNWYQSVAKEAEKNGFNAEVLKMPDSHNPSVSQWPEKVLNIVGEVDEDTYFIGHSIGCLTIMKFLQSEVADGDSCGGVIFVAPWFNLSKAALPDEEYRTIAKPWLEMKLNFNNIKNKSRKFTAFFSDNDPYVPMNNVTKFQDHLDAEIIIEPQMGHYDNESAGIVELQQVVDKLLEISEN